MDWDVMLVVALWTYRMAYKATTQYTPFKLVYDTQPIMPIEFVVPIKRVCDLPQEELNKVIWVKMEDLFRLDKTHWQAKENINHIQLLHKEQRDEKGKIKSFKEGKLVLWMFKATKIKGGKFTLPWKGPFKIEKVFDNNTMELSTISDEGVKRVTINKLKVYFHNPPTNVIITVFIVDTT
jgi:hypothetical protein